MAKQKAVSKGKKESTATKQKAVKSESKPKTKKRKRTKAQINRVKEKGNRLAIMIGAIIALSSIRWTVKSETVKDLLYVVTLTSRGLICQCEANAGGKMICKHSFGVSRLLEIEWWKNRTRKRIKIKRQRIRCRDSDCPSEKVVRNGKRKCKKKGLVQRYLCRSCNKTFSGIAGFVGRHYDEATITDALFHVAMKLSTDEARKSLGFHGVAIHETTIQRWVDCYSEIMRKYAGTLCVDAGHQWHVDEIFFKIRNLERYLFSVMDGSSRFVLSYEISPKKQGFNATGLFATAAARVLRLPRILVTDGLKAFIKPAKKIFYRVRGPRFTHVREIHLQNIFNQNNLSESLNGEYADRFRCIRGLKSDDPGLIHLMIAHHNFFREHEGLENNMTPADAIGIDIIPGRTLIAQNHAISGSHLSRMLPSMHPRPEHMFNTLPHSTCHHTKYAHLISVRIQHTPNTYSSRQLLCHCYKVLGSCKVTCASASTKPFKSERSGNIFI